MTTETTGERRLTLEVTLLEDPDETERAPREHDGECEARGPGDEPVPERLQS